MEEFQNQRGINPETTGGTLARCGYPGVAELHGPAGGRAATWYDRESEVVWFLAFDPQHRYERLETRAANGELMPSVDDETDLELEREKREFDDRVRDDLRKLAKDAAGRPGEIVRGRVGSLLRLEATVTAITVGSGALMDLFVSVRLPLRPNGTPAPPGWPAGDLPERLVSLVFNEARPWDSPQQVPDGAGGTRPIRHDEEPVLLVPNCDPADFGL